MGGGREIQQHILDTVYAKLEESSNRTSASGWEVASMKFATSGIIGMTGDRKGLYGWLMLRIWMPAKCKYGLQVYVAFGGE